jgi:predicted alpha-1,6-mannanase (GH76 family)
MNLSREELKQFMIEELKIVQDIIKRMALNSFLIKGWTITLVVATLLLKGEKFQSFIAFIPILVFWYLDAYFLWLERLYRRLYDWIAKNRLNTDEFLFDMDYRRFIKEEQSKFRIMFSITLGWFYGSIFILTLIYVIFST